MCVCVDTPMASVVLEDTFTHQGLDMSAPRARARTHTHAHTHARTHTDTHIHTHTRTLAHVLDLDGGVLRFGLPHDCAELVSLAHLVVLPLATVDDEVALPVVVERGMEGVWGVWEWWVGVVCGCGVRVGAG